MAKTLKIKVNPKWFIHLFYKHFGAHRVRNLVLSYYRGILFVLNKGLMGIVPGGILLKDTTESGNMKF